jgi:hypothetical protein
VNNFGFWTATRTDRGLTAAHSGTALAVGSDIAVAAKRLKGISPMPFGVPAYVADQESHPPRDRAVG